MKHTKKIILSSISCFIMIISILSNFSPTLLYAEQIDTDSLIMEKSDNLQIIKNHNSDNNHNDGKFNIAVAADWGCTEDTEKTAENIQSKNPELVIAAGDLSYEESADCWFEIIEPFMSKMKIAVGDHEYSDTTDEEKGIISQYLKPLNLPKTYYSFDRNNVHFVFIDPYINYEPGSVQYQFIEHDLRNAALNPKIDWTFVAESIPIYTSPSDHPADSNIRDIYHPLFDKYGVDLVFTSDNHNYQRTYPLKYNSEGDSSNNPIIADNRHNYYNYNDDNGVIYLITGTGGRSLYEIEQQAPFVANQNDQHFGFLNIDINDKTLIGTFYANQDDDPQYYSVSSVNNNMIDRFIISNMEFQELEVS
jgi:calcineurin-like phosphoesterase family protein